MIRAGPGFGFNKEGFPLSEFSASQSAGVEALLDELRELFPAKLHKHIFLTGGTVRDHLMGKPFEGADLVAALPAADLLALGFRLIAGKSTAPIYSKGHTALGKIEVTPMAEGQTLREELLRRDFRCNAVAMSLNGEILDPLNGRWDIERRVLIPCSLETINADPIRIFRAFRFETAGWCISAELESLIGQGGWDPALSDIPVERFSCELLKSMEGTHPARFFSRMVELDAGRNYLPELFLMPDIPAGPPKYHEETSLLVHCLQVLQRMAERCGDPVGRLAAFFHDLGKLATPREMLPRHIGHDRAGVEIAREVCGRLKLPAAVGTAAVAANRLHLIAGRWEELRDATRLNLGEQALEGGIAMYLPSLIEADRDVIDPMPEWEQVLNVVKMTVSQLGIDVQALGRLPVPERKGFITRRRIAVLKDRLLSNHTS